MTGSALSGTMVIMDQTRLFPPTIRASFRNRPNRFIVECMVRNRPVRAYLPNPGKLWELFFPGSILRLVRNAASCGGSTDYTVVAVERDGILLMLHTHINNIVARRLIEQDKIPGLEGSTIVRPEIAIGTSRFDFLLRRKGREVVIEIKSCTLAGNSIAMFPDAVTTRGTRHLRELANLAREGKQAAVIFIVHWPKARYFMPEWHTDLEFSRTLLAVKDSVLVRAVSVAWGKDLALGATRELVIPWSLVEKEARDSGSYIVILQLKRDRRLLIGGMGEVQFQKGYYLYVGSARVNLTGRVERHRRMIKKHRWHIDYLRAAADFHAALPIRTSADLECDVASALKNIAGWSIPGFGSSDCTCESHLLGMSEDPVHTRTFIRLLQYFRMDRLENLFPLQ